MDVESASLEFHSAAFTEGITAQSGEEMHCCAAQLGHANCADRSTTSGVFEARCCMGHPACRRQLIHLQERHPLHMADNGQAQLEALQIGNQSSYSSSNSLIRPS